MSPGGKLVAGRATAEGTQRYAEKLAGRVAAGHFRELAGGAAASTLGLGTYLGPEDGATDVRFTHVGLVPDYECFDICSNAWGMYVGDSLRSLITTGEGKPSSNPDERRYQEDRVG